MAENPFIKESRRINPLPVIIVAVIVMAGLFLARKGAFIRQQQEQQNTEAPVAITQVESPPLESQPVEEILPLNEETSTIESQEQELAAAQEARRVHKQKQFNIAELLFTTLFLSIFVGIGFFVLGRAIASRHVFLIIWGSFFGGMPYIASNLPLLNNGIFWPFLWHTLLAVAAFKMGKKFDPIKAMDRMMGPRIRIKKPPTKPPNGDNDFINGN
ncbi:MAG: hypothetical protein HYT79_05635 [Elusimicrobia bacterium]|nr:hypothetical protein [Elusimicrobiota bacterium]